MVESLPELARNRPFLESLGRQAEDIDKKKKKSLRLALLGCETNEPYGPIEHTGELFLALLEQASNDPTTVFRIDLYNAKEEDYPDDWAIYDGVILPGSFSAAYDTDPWILRLQSIIQNVIVAKQIPTLGTCFGHQIFAHSFQGGPAGSSCGQATATPSGARGGRFTMPITTIQQQWWLEENNPDLYFTHGDMVAQLPETAVCLGGNDKVPIQAAAYFGTIDEKNDWLNGVVGAKQPFAVTLQAHPEYATSMDRGVERTLCRCLQAQADKGVIGNKELATTDAIASYQRVKTDSVKIIRKVSEMLGWE